MERPALNRAGLNFLGNYSGSGMPEMLTVRDFEGVSF